MTTPTPKQQKLIRLLIENYGKPGDTKSLSQIMQEAGYSEASARNPKLILEGDAVQEKIRPLLDKLEDARDKAIDKLEDTIDKAQYRDLVQSIDKLTKNIQLLDDKPTENVSVEIHKTKQALKDLFNDTEETESD